jgi:nickel-responsive transcriptional regulator NikR
MQRVTITLDDALMEELDAIIAARGYQNRSEAIHDLARAGIREAAEDVGQKRECVAALVYTYDHAARQLSKRLTTAYHEHHELSLASLHVHLDHDTLPGGHGAQGQDRRRAAIRRACHRRARRAPRQDRAHAVRSAGETAQSFA